MRVLLSTIVFFCTFNGIGIVIAVLSEIRKKDYMLISLLLMMFVISFLAAVLYVRG